MFKKRDNIKEVEEGKYLEPKFDKNGLIPVITSDFKTGDILMHGYMNDEALKKTIETKEAHYWSHVMFAVTSNTNVFFNNHVIVTFYFRKSFT